MHRIAVAVVAGDQQDAQTVAQVIDATPEMQVTRVYRDVPSLLRDLPCSPLEVVVVDRRPVTRRKARVGGVVRPDDLLLARETVGHFLRGVHGASTPRAS